MYPMPTISESTTIPVAVTGLMSKKYRKEGRAKARLTDEAKTSLAQIVLDQSRWVQSTARSHERAAIGALNENLTPLKRIVLILKDVGRHAAQVSFISAEIAAKPRRE
jgi:hypothetical protein